MIKVETDVELKGRSKRVVPKSCQSMLSVYLQFLLACLAVGAALLSSRMKVQADTALEAKINIPPILIDSSAQIQSEDMQAEMPPEEVAPAEASKSNEYKVSPEGYPAWENTINIQDDSSLSGYFKAVFSRASENGKERRLNEQEEAEQYIDSLLEQQQCNDCEEAETIQGTPANHDWDTYEAEFVGEWQVAKFWVEKLLRYVPAEARAAGAR
eukprot:CAMPEP_0194676224 /NCGR_PEP_ID=MMETSP0295-20121207/8743_1 /TAXON_ID=39354 /ORGANISM="Heterosigma akashiwo, Strain CCMP2393" /LENGTH=212 /DNA_ID=CAMNT_0039560743 /DNA_START=18 /DNA_END=652 /DNA_ORIENTATION=-